MSDARAQNGTDNGPDSTVASRRAPDGVSHTWRALRHRNFRLFFGGQTISLVGTWMTRVATAWLVYRLTKSALLLGTISFAGQIPTFIFAPFAGVLVDRLNRRQVLVWTQALSMVQSLALAALTFSGHITIRWILCLSVLQGIVNAFDMPGRQAFMVQMIDDRADLGNAIAINSSMVNVARLIGPSLAGMLIAVTSEGWCFLVDGISYIAVIVSLLMMRLKGSYRHPLRVASSTWTAAERRLDVCLRLSAHPHHPHTVCGHQPHGYALPCAHAHLRRAGAARRPAYPGLSYGCERLWRAHLRHFAGRA